MNILEINGITKDYANHRALDDVSLSIPEKSVFGLLGPNGAGKTTLIRIINQISSMDQGKITFNGEKLRQQHVNRIGYLPEERGLYRKMKVGEMALYLAQLKGLSKAQAMEKLEHWFTKFDIIDWWYRKVEELSKGMQQKIQFIITIIHEPDLLVFDEPFSGFDPINQVMLKEEILKQKERGAAIIFSTHNMASVEEICDNIALIHNSKVILQGEVQALKEEYKANEFEIVLANFNKPIQSLNDHEMKIVSDNSEDGLFKGRLRTTSQLSTNEVIRKLISFGEIRSFREVLPTMNDIFIKNVNEIPKE
ncbi:MAG: ATP-binding cassette domain-containing protein [Bacteroidales bacterium]|nr:ATP-binding cassette domain-containing protein [Bacteroidales bacterium]MCF8327855.1 ATP-binding cassette domain-containing protein [Bacteroidales bacterium]